jgi:putative ATPase
VVTLIGATTENPSFEVNAPLLSRTKVLRLEPLSNDDRAVVAQRALSDPNRGLVSAEAKINDEALQMLLKAAHGDARRLLNSMEIAVSLCIEDGVDTVTTSHVEDALQQKTLLYDKAGDEHYGVVSALIKSMRGSDPDAAVYWVTRMLEAGEDPLFILRRLVIFASEDIGNADPQALAVATGALASFRFIGLPEGVLPITQATTYLACAPKSNTALTTYAAARKAVREHGPLPVPKKLLNAPTKLAEEMGHGRNYKYPHNFDGHYVAETYLPDELEGQRYYEPSTSGYEDEIRERLEAMKRAGEGE